MRVVSFYSFKGGVGRSLAALGCFRDLVRQHGLKVAVLDFDLEAPGLTLLPELGGDLPTSDGAVEFMLSRRAGDESPALDLRWLHLIDDVFEACPPPQARGVVVPAGAVNHPDYPSRLVDLNPSANMPGEGDSLLRAIVHAVEERAAPDLLLIDSRTGLSAEAVLALGVADAVVVITALNEQSIRGAGPLFKNIVADLSSRDRDAGCAILVASPMPAGEMRLKEERLRRCTTMCGRSPDVELPYLARIALTDEPLGFGEAPVLEAGYSAIVLKILDAVELGGHKLDAVGDALVNARFAEAERRARQYRGRNPTDPRGYLAWAAALRGLGRLAHARDVLLEGGQASRLRGLDDGVFNLALGDLDQAQRGAADGDPDEET